MKGKHMKLLTNIILYILPALCIGYCVGLYVAAEVK
jgi:hypothetical protein